MNERIKELAADAGYPDYMTYGQDKVLEKFAELIIRECAQYIEDKFDFCGDEIIIAEKLKEQFGIK
jgi:hypothetical protein